MLGEFVDDYTIRVADVFAMPQVRFFVFRWRKRRAKGKNLDLETQTHPLSFPLSKKKKKTQSGTGVSVEAVDPVFQTRMLDMLRQVGRPEMVNSKKKITEREESARESFFFLSFFVFSRSPASCCFFPSRALIFGTFFFRTCLVLFEPSSDALGARGTS